MTQKYPISNKQLIIRIIIILLISSIFSIIIASFYIKQVALNNLGEDDAKKTSTLIFEIMNTKMQEGWGKDDLVIILNKLEHIRAGLKVRSYRSEKIETVFGIHKEDKKIVQNDIYIQKAMKGEKQFLIQEDGGIRYLYPMHVREECISCHYNTKIGDVNGVLDIQYPPSEIKISLDNLISYFILFFILFILVCFIILYLIINKKIIMPIVKFTDTIVDISKDANLSKKSNIKPNIKELFILEDNFNLLLEKIKYYYDKLITNLYTDSLTKLPNIVKLEEDIKKNEYNTLLIINIDSFKEINSFYGVKVGDSILKQIAMYLYEKTKNIHTIYRLYSDEFAILTQEDLSKDYCVQLIKSLNKEYCVYEDTDIHVHSSLGVIYKAKNRIIEKATIALRTAKKNKTLYEEFDNSLELQDEYINHIKWSLNLKEALDNNKLVPFFQPIKDLKTGEIKKYECLARMLYDDKVHSPFVFMDISKKARLYPLITQSIIEKSFKYFSIRPNIDFSINISIDDIVHFETYTYLFKMLEKYEIGSQLIIELLESEEIKDFNLLDRFIKRIKEYNVRVAIDDFGSGYSNFSYIINLKVDFLKIDSSLIENIDKNKDSEVVVKSIVDFAKNVNLKTIAEMVHNKEIEDILKKLDIDFVQGYYIGKPKEDIL